jgi:outer membrane biosynthesis protein TonB
MKAPAIPDRYVKMIIERKAPPPPPPPPPKVEDKKPEPVPQEKPKPELDARAKAQQSGLLKLQDQLADLRDIQIPQDNKQELIGAVAENARSERNLITAKVGTGSGGINTAGMSRGYGAGSGPLGDINTTQVTSSVLQKQGDTVKRAAGSTKASRSEEEIVRIFDRNKGAIYAIYTRALRDKPDLKGKLVLELTISPEGEIVKCDVVSSDLDDPELVRKLVARVKLFRFEPRDVGTITVTKPIDFFPA